MTYQHSWALETARDICTHWWKSERAHDKNWPEYTGHNLDVINLVEKELQPLREWEAYSYLYDTLQTVEG